MAVSFSTKGPELETPGLWGQLWLCPLALKVALVLPKECGEVRLLVAQKPISRPVHGKKSLLYFRCWQLVEGRVVYICLRVDSAPTGNQRVRAFTDRRRGLHAETAQSALTVIFRSVIGCLASVRPCLFDVQLIFSSSLPRRLKRICLPCRRSRFDPWVRKIPWRRK